MYPISDLFNTYLQERSRKWLLKVEINGVEYGSNSVVDFTVENNLVGGQEFEIGTAVISKLTLRLKTTDVIPENARVVPYVALQLPLSLDGANVAWQDANVAWQDADYPWQGAVTEWIPLGEFYIDKREQIKNIWEFTCLDKLIWASVPYVSQLTYPTTMRAVWDEICTSLGYTYDNSVVINSTYRILAGPAGFTKLQMLGYIAAANAASVYVAKDGTLRFRRFSAADQPVVEFTDRDYIRYKQTGPVKTYTRVVVVYDAEDDLFYEAGSGDENHTLYVDLPFATQEITNDLLARLNGFSYMPVEMDARGYPQIELGDRFRFGNPAVSPTWNSADISWQAADFTWDGFDGSGGISLVLNQVYTFRGGLKMSIDAPAKSEQESEFEVEGTLSGQINRLNKNAVKLGKNYYGVSVSREEGFIVQREDGLSKAHFNSDDLSFWAEGERALWFDVPSRKFKFAGTLEAVDGVFSGELSAATGTFAGELSAASGTFTGELVAATGTFKGELQAATGTFGGIYTGTITADQIDVSGGRIKAGQIEVENIVAQQVKVGISIDSPLITAGVITGASIIGGSITSDTVINVGTDIYVGSNIHLQGSSSTRTIYFGTSGAITANGDTISLSSPNGVSMTGELFVSGTNIRSSLDGKAGKWVSTSPSGGHNHGIPPGTRLMVEGGGYVTWIAAGDHSHTQN